jgi:hypothetical protein
VAGFDVLGVTFRTELMPMVIKIYTVCMYVCMYVCIK